MVYLAPAAGAVLVADDVADAEADVLVDVVDVLLDLLSEPQPTNTRPSATVEIAAVKYFIDRISRKKSVGTCAVRVGLRLAEIMRNVLLVRLPPAYPSRNTPGTRRLCSKRQL